MATVYLFLHRPYHYQMLCTRQARLVLSEDQDYTPPIVIKIKVLVWSKTMTEARRRRVWTVDNSKIDPTFPFPFPLLLFPNFPVPRQRYWSPTITKDEKKKNSLFKHSPSTVLSQHRHHACTDILWAGYEKMSQ